MTSVADRRRDPYDPGETLGDTLDRRAAHDGDAVALRDGDGTTLTFALLADRVARARGRLAACGLGPGDRVAIALGNGLAWPVAWLGVVTGGMTAIPVNARSGPDDARHLLVHGGARLALVDDDTAPVLAAATDGAIDAELVTDDWPGAAPPVPAVSGPVDRPANVQYTSGTTGLPKGCVLSHRFWQRMGHGMAERMALAPDSVVLTAQPFSYIDPQWNLVATLRSGAELVVLDGFHPSTFMADVARFDVTTFYCLAAMPVLLLKQPPADHDHAHRLEAVHCSAIPAAQHAALEDRWGVPWFELYGMTETGLNIAVERADHDELVGSGSLGTPVDHCDAMVVDDAGRPVADGTEGELVLRGPGFMDGYLDDPDATAAFFAGGWAHTGDLAVRDQRGRFRLSGRRKDMVRRGGENVAAAEVEAALVTHPEVLECAVVAQPDPDLGEELRVVVVPVPGSDPDPTVLHAHLRARLAPFKVPRWWELRDELPHTPSQRVAKHRLGPPVHPLRDLAAPRPDGPPGGAASGQA
ncbi:AMP-binding protein [Salsipaludibacter albus]|uniref:AMP-binding protein n=1 Tax=Salsipaludibacter albus TaxID=2849650 RepID=UPI001EE4A45A